MRIKPPSSKRPRPRAASPSLILLNKPFGVLCQFSDPAGRPCLADHVDVPGVYPAGRLDRDSEGLVLLTDDGPLQHRIADPVHALEKVYLAQLEGEIDDAALAALQAGPLLRDGPTRPCAARRVETPEWLWPRDPPVRYRAQIPTRWIELRIREGRNRQVRRMTAAVGFPTLRLIRVAVGPWGLDGLVPGASRRVPARLDTGTRDGRPARAAGATIASGERRPPASAKETRGGRKWQGSR
ncbi:MAG: pseudouridine synthase [Burkholderiaceae bacterium]|nr:pseudouridine synthase [Burkholderiaceae bacterium]